MARKQRLTVLFGWSMWMIAAVYYALDYFQHTAPSVLIKPIAASLQVSFIDVGNVMSIYFPIYALSQIPAGYLLDRFGINRVLSISCLIVSFGLFCMTGSSMSLLIVGRALIAMGSAFAFLGALKTASAWLPEKVFPVAVGLTNTIGVLGGMLGQPFLNDLIERHGWQHAVFYIVIFGLFLSLALFLLLKQPEQKNPLQAKLKPNLSILKDRNIWFLAIYAGIMVGTVVNAFSELYDVVFLQNIFFINSEKAALISSMVFVGIAIGGPAHGWIARAFKQKRTWMLWSCFLTIVSFSLIVLAAKWHLGEHWLFIFYFLSGFFVSSMLLSFSQARCCYPPEDHASIFAVINMIIGVSGFVFQFLLGESLVWIKAVMVNISVQQVFLYSFWVLLIPLLLSLFFCYKLKRY